MLWQWKKKKTPERAEKDHFKKNKTSSSPKEQTSYKLPTSINTIFVFLFWIGKVTLCITLISMPR